MIQLTLTANQRWLLSEALTLERDKALDQMHADWKWKTKKVQGIVEAHVKALGKLLNLIGNGSDDHGIVLAVPVDQGREILAWLAKGMILHSDRSKA
jgi:hypothetical protein